ncbi:DNA replication complex GINS protein SLD5-like [Saccoglossus kowalevskii]|uniref:DNA replication complex GINS protein SLD5 n=1 Tax=Saccoglossus kowalevskii TaxID=10224 RepID=A0ABM0H1G1_SACKO|nr:PREDICTED: DNA replication complex GINS protein SLD5-like [Saccoglossus kowalevskii]
MADENDVEDYGSDDEVEMTAADVLQKLEEAWLNEKFAPDLLETKVELVECMLEQIQQMEENLKRCKKGDFRIIIHRMEIDRIRYIISSYLRIRLCKIEQFVHHILEAELRRGDEETSRLSNDEFKFAKDFTENLETHLKNVTLRHMPRNLQSIDKDKTAPRPNMNSYIFFKVNESQQGVLVEEETDEHENEVVNLEKDAQHIMRYKPVSTLLLNGAVSLI